MDLSAEFGRWKRSVAEVASGRGRPDAVHHVRVLSRRCHAGCRLLGMKNAALTRFNRSLSPARDIEMLGQHLSSIKSPRLPVREVERRRQTLHRKLAKQLRSATMRQLFASVQDTMRQSASRRKDEKSLIHKAFHKTYKHLHRLWKTRPKRPDSRYLHMLRRMIRRLRYESEFMGGKRFRRLAKEAMVWQRLLGKHQDAVIAQKLLRTLRSKEATLWIPHFEDIEKKTRKQFWKKWRHGGWRKLEKHTQSAKGAIQE